MKRYFVNTRLNRSTILMLLFAFISLTLTSCSVEPAKNISVPPLFTDNMVLQQKQKIVVWGTAEPGGEVTVELNGKTAKSVAAKDGKWKTILPSMKAGGPYKLKINGKDTITINNVMLGEVWICSGQSNMEMPLDGKWSKVNNFRQEVANANYPDIRLLMVKKEMANRPEDNFTSKGWEICSPASVGKFSAVGYFFGRDLYKKIKIPIGLIETSWGGTVVEAWTSAKALKKITEFTDTVKAIEADMQTEEERIAKLKQLQNVWPDKLGEIIVKSGSWEHGFQKPDYDITKWKTMKLPTIWERAGEDNVDGIVWFARDVNIPASWAGKDLTLSLGRINDFDFTWFNGVKVGRGVDVADLRHYKIPGKLVKAGKNRITTEVLDIGGNGGLYGPAEEMKLSDGKTSIDLTGKWKYKIEPNNINVRKLPNKPDQNSGVNRPTVLYNAMIHPLLNYRIRGAIWYQGESNAERAYQYRYLFKTMINDWRNDWNEGDFPFYFVQLANFKQVKALPADDSWAELREAQSMALELHNTGMAVTIDIGDSIDIHPHNKQDVGKRLALIALNKTYGFDIPYSGPIYKSMKIEGDKIRIKFDHADSGLMAKGGDLKGFAIAGEDKKFVWANAKTEGNDVVVWSSKIKKPVAVRYAWAANPVCNLYNGAGLPASPFRTDDWDGITKRKK